MAGQISWWRKLLGQKPKAEIMPGDIRLVPSSETNARANAALPGTAKLEPLLTLVPPPVDPDLVYLPSDEDDRDYAPDPVAEWSVTFDAAQPFDCADLATALHEGHAEFGRPTYHVVTPEGRTTFLTSSDAPSQGVALIPAWALGEWSNPNAKAIVAGAKALAGMLATRPEGFSTPEISAKALAAQMSRVDEIAALSPQRVTIVASHPDDGQFWDGREVWDLLHRIGLRWGDMDCFQWNDPTHQTDHLIWVEVDDADLGYALPERIAAGAQHFRSISFSFEILRTPSPLHVLHQMERMAVTCQKALGSTLSAYLDDKPVDDSDELKQGVERVVARLAEMGLTPGGSSLCRLV